MPNFKDYPEYDLAKNKPSGKTRKVNADQIVEIETLPNTQPQVYRVHLTGGIWFDTTSKPF